MLFMPTDCPHIQTPLSPLEDIQSRPRVTSRTLPLSLVYGNADTYGTCPEFGAVWRRLA